MRLALGFLLLACLFGLAALWHRHTLDELRAEREEAAWIASGRLVETPSGVLPEGYGAVIVGRPSGSDPVGHAGAQGPAAPSGTVEPRAGTAGAADPRSSAGAGDAAGKPPSTPSAPLGDFAMQVQQGQTLSGIAHAHYGHAPFDLVQRLAAYNGLADANALKAGQSLRLPPVERLYPAPR